MPTVASFNALLCFAETTRSPPLCTDPKHPKRLRPPQHTPLNEDTQPPLVQSIALSFQPVSLCWFISLGDLPWGFWRCSGVNPQMRSFQGNFWKKQQENWIHNSLTRKTCAVFCSIAAKCWILHSEARMGLQKSRKKSVVCYNYMPMFMYMCACVCVFTYIQVHTYIWVRLHVCALFFFCLSLWGDLCGLVWFGFFSHALNSSKFLEQPEIKLPLVKEKQKKSQTRGTACGSGSRSTQRRKPCRSGFGSGQARARAAGLCKSWGVSSSHVMKATKIKA